MSASDRYVGKDLKVFWVHSGGTADISGDFRTLDVNREQETADVTAGNDAARTEKATVKVFGASMTYMYIGTAGSASFGSVALGATGTLLYAPGGTATNKPKGGMPLIVKQHSFSVPFDDAIEGTIEWGPAGDELFNPTTDKW